MIRAERVTEFDRLSALEPAWWALWARCPSATPFQSPAWLLAWWRVFAPGRLQASAVWDAETLVAFAPLYLEEATRRLLPIGLGVSDALDVLVDPADPGGFGAALLAVLADAGIRSSWDELHLEELPPDALALALAVPASWRSDVAAQSRCPVLPLPPGPAGIEAVIPAPKLRKLRMARHRTARRGGTIERADAVTAPTHLEHLFRLHALRWESRGKAGVLADPRVQRFHREALPGLVACDLLRASVLRVEGTAAGVFYGFRSGATTFAYLGGFDPAFAFESPGTVLVGAAIEDALGEGARAFNFLRGEEAYKYEWGALDRVNSRRVIRRA